jgi:hypothetical protein
VEVAECSKMLARWLIALLLVSYAERAASSLTTSQNESSSLYYFSLYNVCPETQVSVTHSPKSFTTPFRFISPSARHLKDPKLKLQQRFSAMEERELIRSTTLRSIFGSTNTNLGPHFWALERFVSKLLVAMQSAGHCHQMAPVPHKLLS